MKQTITYTLVLLTAILVSFGFSTLDEKGKVHLKVTKEENGEKSVFEKVYTDMDELRGDTELKDFDVLVDQWANDQKHVFIHKSHDGADGQKKIIIKKTIDGDKEFTWISDEDENIHEEDKHVIIMTDDGDEEIIEIKGEKIIKIKTDGDEKVYTVTSEGDGEHKMVWIDEDGNKTELTEENIEKVLKDHPDVDKLEIHKKIEVISSDDNDGEKSVFIMKGVGTDTAEIEVKVEKEIDEDGNEVIKNKKVWITKDGKKVELNDEDAYDFKTDGDNITIKIDGKTIDIADFSDGAFDGDEMVFVTTKNSGSEGGRQTMNINIEEKNGEKFIEIDIKRNSSLNVTISEILKNDASLNDVDFSLKNNLKAPQLKYYPNPNNGKFNLTFALEQKEDVTVKVIDILGHEVYKEKLLDFNGVYDNEINLIGKEKGIYILQITQKKKALTRKILIE